jgi:hypothetical protein
MYVVRFCLQIGDCTGKRKGTRGRESRKEQKYVSDGGEVMQGWGGGEAGANSPSCPPASEHGNEPPHMTLSRLEGRGKKQRPPLITSIRLGGRDRERRGKKGDARHQETGSMSGLSRSPPSFKQHAQPQTRTRKEAKMHERKTRRGVWTWCGFLFAFCFPCAPGQRRLVYLFVFERILHGNGKACGGGGRGGGRMTEMTYFERCRSRAFAKILFIPH